ncbi:triose-phosphate transporter family-domain-containing protein [Podospora appendiculata]|uniref:Triose-phosphate transporter family-domain-containing protein n=1 Tax=Podospora appendiculata TaxID=314037 RepID=A0AAE1CGX1_9PEZI|nr:triose-phosphate transporter family-domain-containing protein [Podospora appendiculata]
MALFSGPPPRVSFPSMKEKTDSGDLEAQFLQPQHHLVPPISPGLEAENRVPGWTKISYLAVYFLCNISLTIYNKLILGQFGYPWLLTSIHAGSASIGCYILLMRGHFTLTKLSFHQNTVLVLFSILFTINIATSNVSLAMVSIPFHQIMRSTCPFFAVLIYRFRYKRTYPRDTYLSLIPVVLGVGLATYGDYYFTGAGFMLTLLGVILAVIKTVATNRIMTGALALSPLETLLRMSPLAFMQAACCAVLSGELADFRLMNPAGPSRMMLCALAGNGLLAFVLNISSFSTNKIAGALTMTVCGNIKQCLTVLLGIALFGVRVGVLNGLGMLVAMAGAAWYSLVELRSKGGGVRPAKG